MAYSSTKYIGDGSTTDFLVAFDYLDQDHVKVRVDKTFTFEIGSLYKMTWLNSTTVRVDTVSGNNPAPVDADIEFIRETPIDTPAVVFGGGASLSSENLNKNSEYLTFALQEASDQNQEFTKLYLGAFNVFPTSDNDGDALQVGSVIYYIPENALYYYSDLGTWIIGESTLAAQTFATASQASASAAAVSAADALVSEGAAASSQSAAASSQSAASSSASSASASATAANGSAVAAAADAASTAADVLSAVAILADTASERIDAQAAASAASASEAAAAASESAASSSATVANLNASSATASAASASASATSASNSADAAAASLRAVGEPFALWDHIPGCPIPSNSGSAKFIRLTAGQSGVGAYNEGLISSESVSGSSPDIVATAIISVGLMAGQTIRLINTTEEFFRPRTTSGLTQDDQLASHTHQAFFSVAGGSGSAVGVASSSGTSFATSATGGDETRPRNYSATYYMRVV